MISNGSGSYYGNAWEAEQACTGVIFDDEFLAAVKEVGENLGDLVERGSEALDVFVRCMALYAVRDEVEAVYNAL